MGANQSSAGSGEHGQVISTGDNNSRPGGILVVNPTPGTQPTEKQIFLPKRVLPVLTIEGNQIDPQRHKPDKHQLRPQLWTDFTNILGEFAASRAEFVATRQGLLQDKIVQIDNHVQTFTDSYVNEKHKALARMNVDCKKFAEIDKHLQKCTLQSELCVSMLNKLNFLLPEDEKLETLEQ